MAISTIDQAIGGFQPTRSFAKSVTGILVSGRPFSLWSLAGIPGPGGFDNTLNGVTLSAPQNGQLPFTNPVSGSTYLARMVAQSTGAGNSLILADRLWHNGGITITSTASQGITSPTFPARDAAGATSGAGVLLGLEISATCGAGTPTITISYTNSAGTSGRTATNIIATVASSIATSFYPIGLQAGDVGVQSVQSITLSATWTSGTINLVAYREIARVQLAASNVPNAITMLDGMPIMYNDSVPFLILVPSAVTASVVQGSLTVTQG